MPPTKAEPSDPIPAAAFGARVRARREQNGFTQLDLATATNLTRPQVANMESGRTWPSVPTMLRVCAALEVDPGPFFRTPDCVTCNDMPPPGFVCIDCGARKALPEVAPAPPDAPDVS